MTCNELRETLSPYLEDELEANRRRDLENHLSQCQGCRNVLEDVRRVLTAARTLPVHEPSAEFDRALFLRLRDERKRRKPMAGLPDLVSFLRHPSLAWGLVALAAVVVSGTLYWGFGLREQSAVRITQERRSLTRDNAGLDQVPGEPRVRTSIGSEPAYASGSHDQLGARTLAAEHEITQLAQGSAETVRIIPAEQSVEDMTPELEFVLRQADLTDSPATGEDVQYVLPVQQQVMHTVSSGPY
jgi:hypothetical protein